MWLNGWNREKFMDQIEKMNGFQRCVNKNDNCAYRSNPQKMESSSACLVGAFISDDDYFDEKIGDIHGDRVGNVKDLFHNVSSKLLNKMPLSVDNLLDLQLIHDNYNTSYEKGGYKTKHSFKFMIELYLDMIQEAGV